MHTFVHRHFAHCGLIGCVLILIALVIPQHEFQNTEGQAFSPLNHFVSELGWLGISEKALVFNLGLILGGPFLALFMIGLGAQFRGFWAGYTAVLGTTAAIFVSLIGVFPVVNHLPGLVAHLVVAIGFGVTSFSTVVAVTLMVLYNNDGVVPKSSAILSGLVLLSFAGNLIVYPPHHVFPFFDFEAIRIVDRPERWRLPIVEWVIVLSMVAAVFLAALYFEVRRLVKPAQAGSPK